MELGDFVEVALLGFCVLSSLIVVLAMIWRWRGRRPAHLAPSPIAYAFSFWLIAMVILGGYFLSIRIPGLFDVTLDRVGFFLTVAIALVMIFRRQVLPPTDYLIDLLLLLYLALCVISMGIHGFGNDIPGRSKPWYQFLAGYFFPAIAFWVSKYTLTPERDYPLVFKAIFWLGVYVCFIAFLENYHMRGLALPRYIGDRTILTHLDRARGPFLNAAFNGLFLCVAFIAGIAQFSLKPSGSAVVAWGSFFLFAPAIYFTHTRSVLLIFIFIMAGYLFCYRTTLPKWKLIIIPFTLCVLMLAANMEKLSSGDRSAGGLGQASEIQIRMQLVEKSKSLFIEHPFFGAGFGQFRKTSYFSEEKELQHNQIIGIMAEMGLVGLPVYLSMVYLVLSRFFKIVKNSKKEGALNTNFILSLGLIIFTNFFSNCFVDPSVHIFAQVNLFMVIGMVDRLYCRDVIGRRDFG